MPTKRVKGNKSEAFKVILKDIDNQESRVGWFKGNNYPARRNAKGEITGKSVPVAYVAAIQEYGYAEGNIPPRPTIIPTAEKQGPEWADQMKAALNANFDLRSAFEALSLAAVGDIQKAIKELQTPALKDATVRARMRRYATTGGTQDPNKPLIDTGQMVRTLTYQMDEKS